MLRQFLKHPKQMDVINEFLEKKKSTKSHMVDEIGLSYDEVNDIFNALLELEMITDSGNYQYEINWASPIMKVMNDLGCALVEHVISRCYKNGDNYDNAEFLYIGDIPDTEENPEELFDSLISKMTELGDGLDVDISDITERRPDVTEDDVEDIQGLLNCIEFLQHLKDRKNI